VLISHFKWGHVSRLPARLNFFDVLRKILYKLVSLGGGKVIFRSSENFYPKTTAFDVSTAYFKYQLLQPVQLCDKPAAF
jgi:hypothetical protein